MRQRGDWPAMRFSLKNKYAYFQDDQGWTRLEVLENKYNIPRGDLGQRTCSSEKQNKQKLKPNSTTFQKNMCMRWNSDLLT